MTAAKFVIGLTKSHIHTCIDHIVGVSGVRANGNEWSHYMS